MATEILRPNAGGTTTEHPYYDGSIQSADSLNNYLQVDEEVADDNSTYVGYFGSVFGLKTDTYSFENSGVGTGTINSVRVYCRIKITQINGNAYIKTALRTHSTDYLGSEITSTSGEWELNYTEYATNPNTSSAWNWEEIDALEAGVNSYGESEKAGDDGVGCTQVYVEIDYTEEVTGGIGGELYVY